ncbi:thermostable hemolysin [Zooshikella sp. RANM57]|uniref:thermostable hemolysin n=1 Tax=Zooshikella sp. RANM57 TaxID=3425863 RepID=UPI003D6FB783
MGFDLLIVKKETAFYSDIQDIVSQKYQQAFDANVNPSPDEFIVLKSKSEQLAGGIFGFTQSNNALFSEHYLDNQLQFICGAKRSQIAEIGSFASHQVSKAGKTVMSLMPLLMHKRNIKYVVMTATNRVQGILDELEISYEVITQAKHCRVADPNVNWGSYYENDPQVCLIDIKQSILNTLSNHYAKELNINFNVAA